MGWVQAAAPARLDGKAAFRRPARLAGATDCAQFGWGRGGLQGAIIGGAFVVCAMMKSTPLGVGGGLAGATAAASAIAPALGHQQEGDYNRRCIYFMPQPVGSPPPGGRAHGMGAGGSPCQIGRNSGVSPPGQTGRGYRLRPIWVGQRGDTRASSAFVPPNYGGERG